MSHIQALPAGTELVSDFRIEHVLGAGGFGITYLAREIALDRAVTIKEYFPSDFAARGGDVSAVPRSQDCAPDYQWGLDRFIEEAQTLAKFDHPNIVRVYRYFRANNTGYMVLQFEEGQSLKGWLQSLGRAPRQAELDRVVAPMLDALAIVHAADFLHRDIAPDNIMIRPDGSPVLIDFGSARGDIAQHSRTVSALVKPGYSPYEQYGEIGRQQGPWTDIYALAATLYHAITGKRPPDAPSRVVNDEIRPAREAALSAYRPAFLKAIDRGLRIDIDKRPQSVAEWRQMLQAPDERQGQRGWFGTKRPEAEVDVDEVAPTRALTIPVAPAEQIPPPPDLAAGPNDAGRRGRIVDFLDGVRASPREAIGSSTVAPVSAEKVLDAAVQRPSPDKTVPQRGIGFFRRSPKEKAETPPEAPSAEVISQDRAVDVRSVANVVQRAAAPAKAVKRKPPRPRKVRNKSGWRWFPLVTKFAVGVAVATFLVKLQQSMPHFEFRSSSTIASSSERTPVSKTVTSSIARTKVERSQVGKKKDHNAAVKKPTRQVARSDQSRREAEAVPKRAPVSLLLRTFAAHAGGTTSVTFADQGRKLVTIGGDGLLKVWNAKDYQLARTLELEDGPAMSIATAGNRALTGHENGRVALWDLELGMQLKTFKRNDAPITSLVFAGADKFLASANDWSVTIWEVATPTVPLHVFEGHGRDVLAVAYEPGRGLIASGSADRTVRLWETKSLSLVRTYPKLKDFVTAVAFSPDGDSLLVGTLKGRLSLYSTSKRSRKRRFRGHGGRITSLKFFDGGREFVSGSADGTVRLWNRRDGRALQTYGSAGAKIAKVAISPDGRRIAAAKENGTVQIWNGVVLD